MRELQMMMPMWGITPHGRLRGRYEKEVLLI